MGKYKTIHVSPEFHSEFKVYAALQQKSIGELTEIIIRKHMNETKYSNDEELKVFEKGEVK